MENPIIEIQKRFVTAVFSGDEDTVRALRPNPLLPAAMGASYVVASVSSVALPLPETYAAFQRGHTGSFPWARAAIGSLGTLSLGLVNGVNGTVSLTTHRYG